MRIDEGRMDKLVRRNAGMVARYLEAVLPKYERSGQVPETPFDRRAKGSSAPPVGNHALAVMDANREAAGLINPALEEMKRHDISYAGIRFNDVMIWVRYDPGVIKKWRSAETDYDKKMGETFWKMCLLLSQAITSRYEGVELNVVVNPEEEPADNPRHAQVIDTMHTRRLMIQQLEELERETGYTGLMAMEILCERKAREGKDWSVPKLRRARTEINKQREGAA